MGEIRFHQPRDPLGQFAKFEAEIHRQLEREAEQYQQEVADKIKSQIIRPTDSTGRLVQVTLDPQNRKVTPSTWRVGIASFLNKSQAKYWRTVEQGSLAVWKRPFIGTPLRFNSAGFPGGRQFRSFPKGTKFRGDSFSVFGAPNANGQGAGFRVVTVKHEIVGQDSYRKAFVEGNWEARIRRDFKQSVGRYF